MSAVEKPVADEPSRWCWYHEGDERVPVLASEGEAHGEAMEWINNNVEPGEEHEYLIAPIKSGLDLLPSAKSIGDSIVEQIGNDLSDEMGAEEEPIEFTPDDIKKLGELVRQFYLDHGKVAWWTVDHTKEVKHTYVAGSSDQQPAIVHLPSDDTEGGAA